MGRKKISDEEKAKYVNMNFKFNPQDIYDFGMLKARTGKTNIQLMRGMMGLSMEMLTIDKQLEEIESDPKIK